MGADSKIEWTDHTFNPWRGCTKVSAGCAHCYAERQSKRNPAVLGVWGDGGTRVIASETYWAQLDAWNREALFAGERRRVFCASLADWLEDRPELDAPRKRLVQAIPALHHLDFLLLSKRLHLAEDLFRRIGVSLGDFLSLPNVWLGTSVEDQAAADSRIPVLLQLPARVRFLSCEPLLGPVLLERQFKDGARQTYLDGQYRGIECKGVDGNPDFVVDTAEPKLPRIHWVIAGGESGPGARPMHPDWARSLRDQCQVAGVAFHFKQWGEWCPIDECFPGDERHASCDLWPGEPSDPSTLPTLFYRKGKAAAGRLLDGRTWDEFPEVAR